MTVQKKDGSKVNSIRSVEKCQPGLEIETQSVARAQTSTENSQFKWNFCNSMKCCIVSEAMLVALLCLAGFIQGFIVNGLINVTLTTLQTRYQIGTFKMGMVASTYDITGIIAVLPITWAFNGFHMGRVIGISFLLVGIGSFIYSLPQYALDSYSDSLWYVFYPSENRSECSNCPVKVQPRFNLENDNDNAFWYLVLGQILHGLGAQALVTMAYTYLDANLSQRGTPRAIGFFQACMVLGPAIGFVSGGALLKTWVDLNNELTLDVRINTLNDKHDLWVGNWWVGFNFMSVAALIIGGLIAALPRSLKAQRKNQLTKRVEYQKVTNLNAKKYKDMSKGRKLLADFVDLVKNIPFVCISIAMALESGSLTFSSSFMVKYAEEQFKVTTTESAIYTGSVIILAGVSGQVIGGLVIARLDPVVRTHMKFIIVSLALSVCGYFCFFYRCGETDFVGVNLAHSNGEVGLGNTCNHAATTARPCNCTMVNYKPICIEGKSYYSPCFAGCEQDGKLNTSGAQNGDSPAWGTCHCHDGFLPDSSVTEGTCPFKEKCNFANFIGMYFIAGFINFLPGVSAMTTLLGVVPKSLRSQALGANTFVIRLIGSIPGPIIGGLLIDRCCLLFQDDSQDCEEKVGACRLYDRKALMYTFLSVHIVYKILGILFWVGCLASYKPVKLSKSQEMEHNAEELALELSGKRHSELSPDFHIEKTDEETPEKNYL